jgi:uncharacterized membrane protein YidH (DUF202 family)
VSQDRLFDAGAPLERTQMAWTRTGLAMLATSAVAVRLLLSEPLWLVVAVAFVGVAAGSGLLLRGQSRYRLVHDDLWVTSEGKPAVELPAAVGLGVTAAVVVLSGLLALSAFTGDV